MRFHAVVMLCGVSVWLASCSNEHATSCVGVSKTALSAERMSEVDKYFMNTDFEHYIGATVGELARDFAIKYKKRIAVTNSTSSQLVGLTYTFSGNYSLHLFFSEAKHTTYNAKTGKWNFRRLDQERIAGINIKHASSGDFYYCKDFGEMARSKSPAVASW